MINKASRRFTVSAHAMARFALSVALITGSAFAPALAGGPQEEPVPTAEQLEAPMKFAIYYGEAGSVEVKAIGTITPDTPRDFADYLKLMSEKKLRIRSLWFNSPGGNLDGALRFGRMIRGEKIDSNLDGICLSACAYAFLGGPHRYISFPNALDNGRDNKVRIGFHQFEGPLAAAFLSSPEKAQAFSADLSGQSQVTSSELAKYVADMGVDAGILKLASSATPSDMSFPDLKTLEELRVALGDERGWNVQLLAEGDHLLAVGIETGTDFRYQTSFECSSAGGGAVRPVVILTKPKETLELSDYPGLIQDPHSVRMTLLSDYQKKPDEYFAVTDGSVIGAVRLFVEGGAHQNFEAPQVRLLADARWAHILLYPSEALAADIVHLGNLSAQVEFGENDTSAYWLTSMALNGRERNAVRVAWRECRPPVTAQH
ncbi:hypothetical protein [Sphingomonas kyeonggiensis]|uniref:ClpP protease-like protein n=1 Tax=Sphingomonas kyeonggiensis TaxID=1268553 RepID=A0A7W6JSK3_9SPHN|nr:hypothetical protein [Sphingomonas kyeonggiensis]MBB4097625.1 hypothetical protein [Sphingomonas kyeonggiensis]